MFVFLDELIFGRAGFVMLETGLVKARGKRFIVFYGRLLPWISLVALTDVVKVSFVWKGVIIIVGR
jgi:hypothetical protein